MERNAERRFTEEINKGHGRIEQRSIEVMAAYNRMINHPCVKQVFRVRRISRSSKVRDTLSESAN